MTVVDAIIAILRKGNMRAVDGKIKIRIPEDSRSELQPAIEEIRKEKATAMRLLAGGGDFIDGRTIELWSDVVSGRLFIVSDSVDLMRLRDRADVELVAHINNQKMAGEVNRLKRNINYGR